MQANIVDDKGNVIGVLPFTARGAGHAFSSGSRGYHATGKIAVNGAPHQVNFMLIEVGSKPGSKGAKANANGPVEIVQPATVKVAKAVAGGKR